MGGGIFKCVVFKRKYLIRCDPVYYKEEERGWFGKDNFTK